MRTFYLALVGGLAIVGSMNATGRCDCGCGGSTPGCANCGSAPCGDCGCPEPYCCDHTCNSGWICGGGCACGRPCGGLLFDLGLLPGRDCCNGQRWRPCDACGCNASRGCGETCGCHESCGCAKSSGCGESCGCHESCGCDCCRPKLLPCLFPWIRCERCKGAGEQYGECSHCGCGELYINDWRSQPPRCEPCNCCGNWVGPGEPMPSYQMPPRVGSGSYGGSMNGPTNYQGRGTDDSMPMTAPPSAPPPTSLPPANPPMHTTQRPGAKWSNY